MDSRFQKKRLYFCDVKLKSGKIREVQLTVFVPFNLKSKKNINMKRIELLFIPALICGAMFTGCSNNEVPQNEKPAGELYVIGANSVDVRSATVQAGDKTGLVFTDEDIVSFNAMFGEIVFAESKFDEIISRLNLHTELHFFIDDKPVFDPPIQIHYGWGLSDSYFDLQFRTDGVKTYLTDMYMYSDSLSMQIDREQWEQAVEKNKQKRKKELDVLISYLRAVDKITEQEAPLPQEYVPSSECEILMFMDSLHLVQWAISGTDITAVYPAGTDLSSITPYIYLSTNASVHPHSGTIMDFSNDREITYTVTAEDGTKKIYKAKASVEAQAKVDESPSECDCYKDVIISETEYEHAPAESFTIQEMKIKDDCLTIKFSASGCDGKSWNVKLIGWGNYDKSNPPQTTLKLSLNNKEECLAVISKEVSFNLKPLKEYFQHHRTNQLYLNISGKSILYEYANGKDNLKIGEETEIELGETVENTQSGLSLRVDAINDGRCPIGVQCVWGGNAAVDFQLTTKNGKYDFTLDTFAGPTTMMNPTVFKIDTVIERLRYELIDVLPYPVFVEGNIMRVQQTVKIIVTRLQ